MHRHIDIGPTSRRSRRSIQPRASSQCRVSPAKASRRSGLSRSSKPFSLVEDQLALAGDAQPINLAIMRDLYLAGTVEQGFRRIDGAALSGCTTIVGRGARLICSLHGPWLAFPRGLAGIELAGRILSSILEFYSHVNDRTQHTSGCFIFRDPRKAAAKQKSALERARFTSREREIRLA